MALSTYDLLCRVRVRLTPPDQWTKRAPARDKNGNTCAPRGPAVAWSFSGALEAEISCPDDYRAVNALVLDVLGGEYRAVAEFEDRPTTEQRDVLAVLDRARAVCQGRAAGGGR